jgi:predicted metal-dependent peptidase
MSNLVTPHQQALNKAKIAMMRSPNSAFICTVCFSLKIEWSDRVSTAATDGKRIIFNIGFWMALTPAEQLFLLLHETWHVCFMHMLRLKGRIHRVWNMAADYVINLMLVKAGYQMPSMGLLDYKYDGMNAEQVYELLIQEPEDKPEYEMDLEESDATAQDAQQEVQDILVRASMQSKMNDAPGTIPGDIELFIKNMLHPKLPAKQILAKYLQNINKSDYSMRRPNKRYFPSYHLPTLHSTGQLIDIAIAVDISGSVSDNDFAQFISETHNIVKVLKPKSIQVLHFNTQVVAVNKVKNIRDLLNIKFSGRGGTAIEPVMQWVKENTPKVILIFTDGEFRFHQPNKPRNTEVVWLIHDNNNFSAPFGKVIHYQINRETS